MTVPLHGLVPRARPRPGHRPAPRRSAVRAALRDRGFWLLVAVFFLHGAAVTIVSIHIVAYLRDALPGFRVDVRDHGAGAVSLHAVRGTPTRVFNFHIDTVPAADGLFGSYSPKP